MIDESVPPRPSSAESPTRTSVDPMRRLAAGSLLARRYRIRELVGVGGMGMVYRADDETLGVEIAVKVLRPELLAHPSAIERFRKELILARQVSHRNAVRIHDLGEDGDLRFLTMDFVRGRSLHQILEEEGPLTVERAEAVVRQVAAALAAAHAQGIVHRDLKPENVLISDADEAFITDFGIARSLTDSGLTRAGALVGTLDYLSPEQARGEEVDGRSDLYALGIVFFEMLSGDLPFPSGSRDETLAQRIAGRPRDLRAVGVEAPARVRRVIARCLERRPSRRYGSAEALLADLDGRGAVRLGPTSRRWMAAGLAVLAAAALAWWAVDRQVDRRAETTVDAGLPRHAIAVLPLVDETGSQDLAWISTGLAELLATALAESPVLRVVDSRRVARTLEDLRFEPRPLRREELQQLAEVFEVSRLIAGRVRRAGTELRVDLELVAADHPGLPVTRLEAATAATEAVNDLVGQLASALHERLAVPPAPLTAVTVPADPLALRAATEASRSLEQGDAIAAVPALERAVEAAPEYAPAWLRLAEAYDQLGYRGRALEASGKALAGLGETTSRLAYEARARDALLRGQPRRAQRALHELVERYPNDMEARVTLAEAYGESGGLVDAMRELEEVVRLDPSHPRAWFLLGKYAIISGDSRRAIDEYLVRAQVIQNRLRSPQGRADVLNAMGVAHDRLGELGQAAETYARAAELRREIGDHRGYATSLRNLARIDIVRGRLGPAREALETARELLEEIGDEAGIADVVNDLGILAEERGVYREALEAYRRSLQLRSDLGDETALAESYNNVGYAFYVLGEYDNANVYWRQGLDLYSSAGNAEGAVFVTQNLALLRLARGEWSEATRLLLEALDESRRLELPEATAVTLGSLSRLALYQGRYRSSRASLEEAKQIVEELADPRGLVEFSLLEARLLLASGRLQSAATRLQDAERWLAESDSHGQRSELLNLRGELALAGGDRAAARQAFVEAETIAAPSESAVILLRSRLGRAWVELANGRAGALEQLQEEVAAAEQLGYLPLTLRAFEALAEGQLAMGVSQQAEESVRRALAEVGRVGDYGRAYRLHLLLARSLETRDEQASGLAQEQARQELERLRVELDLEDREAFDSRPDVREIESTLDVQAS